MIAPKTVASVERPLCRREAGEREKKKARWRRWEGESALAIFIGISSG